MATLTATHMTLLDLVERLDGGGDVLPIVELQSQQNEILQDMSFVEGNETTGHTISIRTGIPQPAFIKINGRVDGSKTNTAQAHFNSGFMRDYSEVDRRIIDKSNNPQLARFTEDSGIIEGFSQKLATTTFYGSEVSDPASFNGLAHYYNDLSAESADNIIDAQGSGSDNASIWLVGWSPMTVFGMIPKNGIPGMQMTDKNTDGNGITSENSDGKVEVYRTLFEQEAGLVVRDWRYVVRICNIDRSDLKADISSSSADLPDLMFEATQLLHSAAGVNAVFYMDRSIRTMLYKQLAHKKQNTIETVEIGGVKVDAFHGFPLRRVDALAVDEAQVT